MEQLARSESKNKSAEKTGTPASRLVAVERVFRAPVERVWEAWTDPALAKQWWGPEGYTCPEAQIDFREGGKYLLAMQGWDGKISWSGGVFEDIQPNKKIEFADRFTDEKGNPVSAEKYGMPGDWTEVQHVTVRFEACGDDDTKIILRHEGIPAEMHDDCVQGWNSSLNKMQRLVERT